MKHLLLLCGIICAMNIAQAQTPIADAKILPVNSTVTVKGIVLNGSELGNVRYIYDGTAGIAVFNAALASNVEQGDSLQVTGTLSDYFGLVEIIQGTGFAYTVINSGNPLPAPATLPAGTGFSEEYEGQLVRFQNTQFAANGNFIGNTNYDISVDGTTQEVRVSTGTNIVGTPIPTEYINMVGIMGQYNSTYQLLPRSLSDFEFIGNPPIFTTALLQSNMTTNGFTVGFTTLNPGTTQIQYGLTPALELPPITDANFITSHSVNLTGLQAGSIYYIRARSVSASGDLSQSSIQTMATVSNSSGDIKVYFNRSVYTDVASSGNVAQYLNQAVDDTLLAYIARAKHTVDICMYSVDNQNNLLTALNAAAANGIQVRVVADSGVSDVIWNLLNVADKERRPASLNGIMHNKFLVIDANSTNANDPIVWTGSTNFTSDQLLQDPNNVIIFQDQSLAKAFQMEFEEMLAGNFSSNKTDNTPKEFLIGGKRVEAYFSPTDLVNASIQRTVQSAEYDLYFALLSFTRTDIAYRISDAYDDGVFIIGILDNASDASAAVVYDILSPELGDQLIVDNYGYIFHHKYLLADPNLTSSDPTVLTGSHNWSNSAQFNNDENTVIVHDANVANLFYQEFVQRYANNGGVQLVNGSVGVQENPLQATAVSVYPNPAANALQISYNAQQIGSTLHLQISDLSGKIVYSTQRSTNNAEPFTIHINDIPNGMYLLNVNGAVHKMVIAH
jgi:phosphatidylserine/phosphatidylglycerophosphate/cardiolipin synthase-like enzyme